MRAEDEEMDLRIVMRVIQMNLMRIIMDE